MKTIWKFELPIENDVVIEMPEDSILLSVQTKDGDLFIWAQVDTDKPKTKNRFRIVGTGTEVDISPSLRFVGTVHMKHGDVLHVFLDTTYFLQVKTSDVRNSLR